MDPVLIQVNGMFCTSCARALEVVLGRLPGVKEARVGFATGVASVELAPGQDRDDVLHRVLCAAERLGYPSKPWTLELAGAPEVGADPELGLRLALGAFLGMWVMVAQVALYAFPAIEGGTRELFARLAGVAATPVVFVVGARFHLAGWRTLRAGVPGMDLLVSMGALGAWGLSIWELAKGGTHPWFDAATALVVLLLAGRMIEAGARERGVSAVRRLLSLSPERARLVRGTGSGQVVMEVAAATVAPGECIEVAPGARLPLDGIVELGCSTLDRGALTGESVAVPVRPGDEVQAGCVNGAGAIVVRVTASVGARELDRIAGLVREAMDRRSEHRGAAERLAERLVPAVVLLAGAVALVGLVLGQPVELALERALTVLVVTCPCALGVAAPLVHVVGIGRLARKGVLASDAQALVRAGLIDTVVFDKTGTLTSGRPVVVGVDELAASAEEIVRLAAQAEAGSEHPIARALRAAAPVAWAGGVREEVPGFGVKWETQGGWVRVGHRGWFAAAPLVETGETEVWVERAGTLLGRIRLRDEPSAEASDVLRALRREGLHVRLLSGDAEAPVRHLAEVVGLVEEEIRWGARPSDKAREIQSWEAEGKRVLFVGDGINDAPALAAATLGVAVMGATDAARASAGMVVRDGSLVRVVELLTIGRETAARTRLSVGWAITYNALAIPLAALGWFGPGLAALGMVLSSLAVTWNAVRGNSGPNERLVAVGGVVPRLNPR